MSRPIKRFNKFVQRERMKQIPDEINNKMKTPQQIRNEVEKEKKRTNKGFIKEYLKFKSDYKDYIDNNNVDTPIDVSDEFILKMFKVKRGNLK